MRRAGASGSGGVEEVRAVHSQLGHFPLDFCVCKRTVSDGYRDEGIRVPVSQRRSARQGSIGLRNDGECYERLVLPVKDQMIRSIWRILHDPDDADDAFQDALTTIWKRLKRVRRHPNPRALILRICVDAAYDTLRRKLRRQRGEDLGPVPDHIPDPACSAVERLSWQEEQAEVRQAITRLSRRQAEALLMRVVQEQAYEDIAQVLGCSEANARTHVARARARLREMLTRFSPYPEGEAVR